MKKIKYNNGKIMLCFNKKKIFLTKIEQITLVYTLLEYYRIKSNNEEEFQFYTTILDSLFSAREEFIINNCVFNSEEQCTKNL